MHNQDDDTPYTDAPNDEQAQKDAVEALVGLYVSVEARNYTLNAIMQMIESMCPGAGVLVVVGFHPATCGGVSDNTLGVVCNMPQETIPPMLLSLLENLNNEQPTHTGPTNAN